MSLSLGVDTGGTFTDAVVVDRSTRRILSASKSLTTKKNLFEGIFSAINQCLEEGSGLFSRDNISIVCLSTTLATNAITEGYGGSVCEILIGYDQNILKQQGFIKELVADEVIWLSGGHDIQGDEAAPLDEFTAIQAIKKCSKRVEAFAVSGYFGIRNPEHELRVKALVQKLTDIPVTCAHELTRHLNSVSRAVTVGHNARLIPLLKNLLLDIERALKELDIVAPLMIVKGNGAVVPAEWAAQRPIETMLSGPAASCVGACNMTGSRDVWVADMGGTTTDIALLKNGRPAIHSEGAYIGNRRSMVESVDIHTVGIGGDSLVEISAQGELTLGPRRAVPLCALAKGNPEILSHLSAKASKIECEKKAEQFITVMRTTDKSLGPDGKKILNQLQNGPLPVLSLTGNRKKYISERLIKQLEGWCLILRSGFTPTDALHVLGRMIRWNQEASLHAATILGNQLGMEAKPFCEYVLKQLEEKVARELISKAIEPKTGFPQWEKEPTASGLIDFALNGKLEDELSCTFQLRKPLVAIGAPVKTYMPVVASKLNAKLILPEYAHVANAFGAATAGIAERNRAVIRIQEGGLAFRVHLPEGVSDFSSLDSAKTYAEEQLKSYVTRQARKAGATNIKIETVWKDPSGKLPAGSNQEIYLDTELIMTAYGDPEMKDIHLDSVSKNLEKKKTLDQNVSSAVNYSIQPREKICTSTPLRLKTKKCI